MKKLILLLLTLTLFNSMFAQRIVMNGAYVNITNGANLVIDNPSNAAITRNSGHIISEGESNIIKWNIGTTTGTYIIPFGFSTIDYLPVTLTKGAGSGSGAILFATYRTSWQNSGMLPTGVPSLNNNSGADNSAFVLDRFWRIEPSGYTTKPGLTNLIFTYADIEHTTPSNTITEVNLQAERWNSTSSTWMDFGLAGTNNSALNTVTVPTVASSDFFAWWTLVDNTSPLPIELLEFKGECDAGNIKLKWTTASETNNSYFTIEKKSGSDNWIKLGTIAGSGNSSSMNSYSYIDEIASSETLYYRLLQTDFDGTSKYCSIISVNCDTGFDEQNLIIYPNPSSGQFILSLSSGFESDLLIQVEDALGKMIFREKYNGNNFLLDLSDHARGVYFVRLTTLSGKTFQKKIVLH